MRLLRATSALLLAAVAVDTGLYVAARGDAARLASAQLHSVSFRPGAAVPAGYFGNGLRFEPAGASSGCYLLRYSSAACTYCWAGRDAWSELARAAAGAGCVPLGVAPRAVMAMSADAYGFASESQLVYTQMDWIEAKPPTRTPTCLVIRSGRVIWSQVGELTSAGVAGALRAIRGPLR